MALTSASLTLVFLASVAPAAQAKTWYLTVQPARVAQGGSVVFKTTARRSCKLTISSGRSHWHYRLPRGGEGFSIPQTAPPGKDEVTVYCKGLVAKDSFRIVLAHRSTQPAPPPTAPAPPAPTPQQTPITVANVCSLNPALGPIHYTTGYDGWPTAYWLAGSKLSLMAFSDDGDAAVDIAAVVGPDGQSIAYFAHCNWPRWLTIAQYEAAQAQQGVPATQASSVGYLVQEQTDDAIFDEDQDWFTPSAGWQECSDNPYDDCDYEPVDP